MFPKTDDQQKELSKITDRDIIVVLDHFSRDLFLSILLPLTSLVASENGLVESPSVGTKRYGPLADATTRLNTFTTTTVPRVSRVTSRL